MHIDWLDCHQDFEDALPLIGVRGFKVVDLVTGEESSIRGSSVVHEGSHSTKLLIKVSGNRLSVSGNPSAFNRLDNLFGFKSIDDCIAVFNVVLVSLGLPPFTRCTRVFFKQGEDGSKVSKFSDGCVLTRIDMTSNRVVGQGNELAYIRGLSALPFGNAIPRLHTNGNTVDWVNKAGRIMQDQYAKAYAKAAQMRDMLLFKAIKKYGAESSEVSYIKSVVEYCAINGVVRFEQSFKSGFLRKNGLAFLGLSYFSDSLTAHDDFLNIDQKLQVTAMDTTTISQLLISSGVVSSSHAANITAMYAINWAHGHNFNFEKSQVKTHRARLRRVGIDIALPCDLTKFSVVSISNIREITVSDLSVPDWYQMPVAPVYAQAA